MKFHDFSPFYRSGEGIRSKVSGDRLIDNPAVADAQSGASFHLNGTTDWVKLDTTMKLNDQMSYEMVIKKDSDLSSTAGAVFNHGQDASNDFRRFIWLQKDGTYGGIRSYKVRNGSLSTGSNFSTSVPADFFSRERHLVYVDDGTAVRIYADGVELPTSIVDGIYDTFPGQSAAQFDIQLGGRYTGNGDSNQTATTSFFDGSISRFKAHNRALSAAEVRASYNGQAVPFEYVGGSQDEMVTNGDFASGGTGWAVNGGWAVTGNEAVFTASGGTGRIYPLSSFTASDSGKKFRLTFTVGSTAGTFWIGNSGGSGDDYLGTSYVTYAANTTHDVTFTLRAGETTIAFYSRSTDTDTSIDDISLAQIGCVAEYLPSGINATQWVDTSGNNLHGTTSTATAVNHTTGTLTLESGANLKMQDGGGIDFTNSTAGGALTGTSSSNLLDDYEEGEFTAVLTPDTSGSIGMNPSYETMTYTKIGRLVYIQGEIRTSSATLPLGVVKLGLPFVPASGDFKLSAAGSVSMHSVAFASNASLAMEIQGLGAYLGSAIFVESTTDGYEGKIEGGDFSGNEELTIGLTYVCAT